MKNLSLLAFLILGFGHLGFTADKPSWEYPAVKIRGRQAEAVAIALQQFRKNQGGRDVSREPVYGDLRHYSVEVIDRGNEIEVVFAPDLGPRDRKNVTLGGRTQYGIEVSYYVSLKDLKIAKTIFAR